MRTQALAIPLALLFSAATAQEAPPRAATPKEERAILQAVKDNLKDPDSARISGVKISADGKTVCGFVNAKNSFGGYSGNSAFYVMAFSRAKESVYVLVSIDNGRESATASMCEKEGVRLY